MKTKNIISAIFMAVLMLLTGVSFTSCQMEDLDTNQFVGDVTLLAYGPSPVARGGQLRFIGTGMDKIKSVTLAGCDEITEIEVISSEEIRITVPQNAQPCYPVLNTKGGAQLTAETRLTFTEPVGFAEEGAMAPNPVKPGQKLTIKGEYLNLVQTVVFSDKAAVTEFAEHTREQIVLTVPAEAKTGKVTLSFVATGDTIPNEIISTEKLDVVIPSVESIVALDDQKPGNKVTISGKDFDLITAVMSPTGDSIEFVATETSVEFNMPANVTNGGISVLTASGVSVDIATVGVALPKDYTLSPAENLRPGDVITITGTNMELVTDVTFPAAAGLVNVSLEADGTSSEIKVILPDAAVSGELKLNTAAGISVGAAYTTKKPALESYDPTTVNAGNDLIINGTDLDLVKKITFADGIEVTSFKAQSATSITVTVPVTVVTGTLKIEMQNGETTEFANLDVNSPVFCVITEMPEDEVKAGAILTCTVINGDVLESVKVNGETCQFIMNGTTLYINVPESAGKNCPIELTSSNGVYSTQFDFIPNTQQSRVAWTGMTEITWNDGGRVMVPLSAFNDVPAGATMTLCYTQKDQTWAQAQINNGAWAQINFNDNSVEGTTLVNGTLVPTDVYGWFTDGELNRETSVVLTQEILDNIRTNADGSGNAIIIQGQDLIFTKVTINWTISLETDIAADCVTQGDQSVAWTFPSLMTWDDTGRFRILRNGANNLQSAVKLGSVIRFYKSGTGQIQVNNANWTSITTVADWVGDVNPLELTVDQAILDCFTGATSDGWSGTALILQGDGLTVQKITVQ